MTELDLRSLVAQLRPTAYLAKTNDWIRGSLPRSSFRIGSPSSERPGPMLDRTDRDVEAERHRWRVWYQVIAYSLEHGDTTGAVRAAVQVLHIEHVALDEKPGDRDLGGWPCQNYGRLYFGARCATNVHDHPNAICQACRDRKHRVDKERRQSSPTESGCSTLTT